MEIKINSDELLRIVSVASSISPRKSTNESFLGLKLRVSGDKLEVLSTDGITSYVGNTECEVIEEGSVCVRSKLLRDVLKSVKGVELLLKSGGDSSVLSLSGKRVKLKLNKINDEDFPSLPEAKKLSMLDMKSSIFMDLIKNVIHSVSTDVVRLYLNGIRLERHESGMLSGVSTDGHRLSYCRSVFDVGDLFGDGVTIPYKMCKELLRIHSLKLNSCEDIRIGLGEESIHIRYGSHYLTSLFLEGSFPSYESVIPKDHKFSVRLNRLELLSCLKSASVMSPDKTKGICVRVSGDILTIESQSEGRGKYLKDVDVIKEGEGDIEMGFNSSYFTETLNVLDCEEVSLLFTNERSPCVVRPVVEEGDSDEDNHIDDSLYVIMPMRLA